MLDAINVKVYVQVGPMEVPVPLFDYVEHLIHGSPPKPRKRSWSRNISMSRHASQRPAGVSCTTSTREVLIPGIYNLLLSSLDDSLRV